MRNFFRSFLATDSVLMMLFKVTVGAVIGVFGIFILGGALLGFIQGTPDNAKDLLQDMDTKAPYAVRGESIRKFKVGETEISQSRVTQARIDPAHKKYTFDMGGFGSAKQRLYYDGQRTLKQGENGQYEIVQNVPFGAVVGPTAKDLLKSKPQFLTDEGTFVDKKAWIIEIKPTCQQLRDWIGAKALKVYMPIQSENEYQLLTKDDCKVKWGYAWVRRDDRRLVMIDTFFTVGKNIEYHYLYKYDLYGQTSLDDLKIEQNEN